jgi:hypothetical protein
LNDPPLHRPQEAILRAASVIRAEGSASALQTHYVRNNAKRETESGRASVYLPGQGTIGSLLRTDSAPIGFGGCASVR